VTWKTKLVQEALKLFEANGQRESYKAGADTFLVSPVYARKQLGAFIQVKEPVRERVQAIMNEAQDA
jgi:hypothetical protein